MPVQQLQVEQVLVLAGSGAEVPVRVFNEGLVFKVRKVGSWSILPEH